MSKRQILKRILGIVAITLSTLILTLNITVGVMLRISGDGTIQLGKTRVTAVDTTAAAFHRGDLIGLMSGSIPENTPVAVRVDGVAVLSSGQLSQAGISREQVLGGVGWAVPFAGWPIVWMNSMLGLLLGMFVPFFIICWGVILLLTSRKGGLPEGFPGTVKAPPADPVLSQLDFKLPKEKTAETPEVKTVLISQTRPASSGIRSKKGEVRVYAGGEERVIPLNLGRRVVSIGEYIITVDIAKESLRVEDVTRELPVMRREQEGKISDTQKIEVIHIE